MPATDSVTVHGDGATLEVTFAMTASASLDANYRLRNTGNVPLMVLDRGDRHAVMTRRLVQGDVPVPRATQEGGDVTLHHLAQPLPEPPPTVPPTPLAARVMPGGELHGEFEYVPSSRAVAGRIRWCLGVAPFSADDFSAMEQGSAPVEVWLASFAMASRQQILCTPWFALDAGRFEAA